MLSYSIVVLCAVGACLAEGKWGYTDVAFTVDGQPCLADCKAGRCIVDWFGNYRKCTTSGVKTPVFSTAQIVDKSNHHCLSNCGFFGHDYEWCITTEGAKWDYCNSSPDDRSIYKSTCKHACMKGTVDYYWCYVEKGSWQYCAPPALMQFPGALQSKPDVQVLLLPSPLKPVSSENNNKESGADVANMEKNKTWKEIYDMD